MLANAVSNTSDLAEASALRHVGAGSPKTRIGLIGYGRIAKGIATGMRDLPGYAIDAVQHNPLREQPAAPHVTFRPSIQELVEHSDIVVPCMQPRDLAEALAPVKGAVNGKLVVSPVAEITSRELEAMLPGARVVRAMPNMSIAIRDSQTFIAHGASADDRDLAVTKRLFAQLGRADVVNESAFSVATVVGGCSPVLAHELIAAIGRAALKHGLPLNVATPAAAQAVKGAAEHILRSGIGPMQAQEAVMGPGGMTIHGLAAFHDRGGLHNAVGAFTDAAVAKDRHRQE